MLKRTLVGVLLAPLTLAALARAQTPFTKISPTVTLSVSSVSSSVAIGTSPRIATLWVCNTGATTAYVQMGDSTIVADTTGIVIPASPFCGNISPDGKLFISAVTASSTTTLTITPGAGLLFSRRLPASGGGGGGCTGAIDFSTGCAPLGGM
jgi:hypothetical protein